MKRIISLLATGLLAAVLLAASLAGCGNDSGQEQPASNPTASNTAIPVDVGVEKVTPPNDKYRTFYEVFVYSFCDSNGDGIGDLNGLTSKLDYIADLGFNGIWLMPIHPSTTYHKYDVMDYRAIDPEYGTMEDFDSFLAACKERGIAVILDMVVNHTSAQHPWFQQAVQALAGGDTENPYVDYYNFVPENPGGSYREAVNGWYYECPFWDQMPDLNLASKAVRGEIRDIMKFWLDKGVAGFRLDAAGEYYSGNTTKNIEVLSWLNSTVKELNTDAYLVAEDWDETDALYDCYASGIDSLFNFPFSQQKGKIARSLLDTQLAASNYTGAMQDAQWAIQAKNPSGISANFFTNHDTARAAGFLRSDPALIKTAWGMNLLQPGAAFLYYGEELGMSGSGKDENKRAPMYWSVNPGYDGMTLGPPDMESVTHRFPAGEEQASDPASILNYVKKAIYIRNKYPEIARGDITGQILFAEPKVMAEEREWNGSDITLLYNLSGEQVTPTMPLESDFVYEYGEILDWLSADGTAPVFSDGVMTLPPWSITLIRKTPVSQP